MAMLLFLIPLIIFVAVAISASILCAAIALFNWFCGASKDGGQATVEEARPIESLNVDRVADDANPYAAPVDYVPRVMPGVPGRGVPVMGMGKALGVSALFMVAGTIAGMVTSFEMADFAIIGGLVLYTAYFFILAGLLTVMLPTKFGKACLVTLLAGVVWIPILVGIVCVAMVVGMVMGYQFQGFGTVGF